jgi:CO/xanthine dehydrogenase Mo-binding subunit
VNRKSKPQTVGSRHIREDADAKLKGRMRFLPDLRLDGMLHAAQLGSPLPHARILGLDLEPARAMPGVVAVLGPEDIPGENRIGVIIDDQPLLAQDKVRYVGEPMAVVAAESAEAARAAVAAIVFELEELPAILDLDQVEAKAEEPIHEEGPIAVHQKLRKGTVERGFADADAVVEAELVTGLQEHYYLEPQGCIATPGESGGLVIHGSLQCPFYVQRDVSRATGIPQSRVRVIQTPTGGAFGGKEDIPSEFCARAAVLALATGRPVRLLLSRDEDFISTSKRHPFRIRGRLGATKDGRFTAMEVYQDAEAGAYATLSPPVIYRACIQGAGPYDIPNVKVETRAWYTNQVPNGAFRGFGSPQACFGHERLVDLMAAELGMDPVEIRRINLLREGGETCTGHKLDESVGALETLERAAEASSKGAGEEEAALEEGRWLFGTGHGAMIYGNCLGKAGWHMDGAGAYLQVHADGSVSCATGLTEFGQGARTVVQQMAAETLGIDPEQVSLMPVDTALVPDSGPTVASRNVVMSGNAILNAAAKLEERLAPLRKELGDVSFTELAGEAYKRNVNLAAEGWWHVPELDFDLKKGRGEAYFAYSFATQSARVAVDRLTGNVRVLKVWAAHDVGCAINPAGVEAQVEGGVAQGLGWALTERFAREGGDILARNLSTYHLPTSIEVPEIETLIVEEPHSEGPFGAKSLGEPVIIPTAAAIAAAVSDALGAQVKEIPIRPEHVLELLERGGHDSNAL